MTAVTGHRCDVCGRIADDRRGWMGLKVHQDGDVPAGKTDGWPDICSNRCLYNLAADRLRDVDGVETVPRTRRRGHSKYDDEFKLKVVERASQVGIADAAREYAISYGTAQSWVKTLEDA
jgi:hypothetical protein